MKSPIHNQMSTVFIHVTDLVRSVKWYCQLLDQEFNEEQISLPVYNLNIEGVTGLTLDAGPEDELKEIHPSMYPLFNLHTNDIQESYLFVKKLNYSIQSDIVYFDDFSCFNIADPDSHVIMICTG
ncbi:VOC family protein [Chengkuizengella axinellae]|uniref:VOC family protein n=1 Tax=Chengkuizengella axinellae TaxID=3064388 RepID=A0ABT9J361_9BACL|nr:VOC family protein [Chengkuizengella sp. 2205SS18-9]MDP5275445.1 VOC family protein [Chengkuizengella sp. 2205SS18-9]